MKRLLVTGAAGFIGSNFVHHRLTRHADERVVAFDALTYAGNTHNLAGAASHTAFRFVRGDISDSALVNRLLTEERIDCVVHFAAESHVDRSISGPDAFISTNIVGTHELLKAARAAWTSGGRMRDDVRFHHVSTDEVYGSLTSEDPPFTETTPYAPNSPYSASKAASDHLVRAYHHTFGLPVTTSNCSNNYGPFHFPEKLIPLLLVRALTGGEMPVYGKGENVRDWLYVEDHCAAISVILARGVLGETYNVGGCNEKKNIDIVRTLCALVERRFRADASLRTRFPECPASRGEPVESLIRFVTDRPGHDWRYAIDAAKLAKELGFTPVETFETGIAKTVDWYLANEAWWRNVMSGEYRNHQLI